MLWEQIDLSLALQFAEILVFLIGFLFTIRSIRQARDSRNIDFIINAEGQVDPLFLSLTEAEPEVVRATLPGVVPPEVPDAKVKAYMNVYYAYRHLSRIIYMLQNDDVSLGMTRRERREHVEDWMNESKKYDQEILIDLHSRCRATGEFNDGFIRQMDKMLGFTS